tara:strand:- start:5493 stop:6383 length:891 start_codon:yes stop_codon:yes gene_type:complete
MMRHLALASVLIALTATATFADAPKRVLSVGGSVTETVFALGMGDTVIAVDDTSYYPWEATHNLPKVGYVRSLAAEGLLSLKSDLLVAGPEAGPPQILDQVQQAGLKVVQLSMGYSPELTLAHIKDIGAALDRSTEAEALTAILAQDLATIQAEIAKTKSKPKVLFLLNAGQGASMAGGRGTAADAMIALAGGVNAAAEIHGYKPISPEAAIVAQPEILMMMSQTVEALGGKDAVLTLPGLAELPAVRNKRLLVLDGLYSLGFGPRLAHAVRDMAADFHPETNFLPLPEREWTKAQ